MKRLFFLLLPLLSFVSAYSQVDTSEQIVPGRTNSAEQQGKPYLIMISADGFRYDYAGKYKANHLLALSAKGVRAKSMIPSYPSLTFPNHYAMVTGLYPSHNGLVHNTYFDKQRRQTYNMGNKAAVADSSWYHGTPLWVLAGKQQMQSASFYWVASEANIQGFKPSYYYNYSTDISIRDRIEKVARWLQLPPEKRPHLITFYMPEVDHAGHYYGPDSPETEKEVLYVDSVINELTKAVSKTGLNVNYIFVADHGMTRVDNDHPLSIPAIDTTKFDVSGDGVLLELYARPGADIAQTFKELKTKAKDYEVFLKTNMPSRLHYRSNDDRYHHMGDILIRPRWPKVFDVYHKTIKPGWHGFDPYLVKDMHATFFAWGPDFKKGITVKPFKNVNVYNIAIKLLGLKLDGPVDGTDETADKVLLKK